MDTAAFIISELIGTDHRTSNDILYVLLTIFVGILIIYLVSSFFFKSSKRTVYISGISDSGKTTLFSQIITGGKSQPITVSSQALNVFENFQTLNRKFLRLIDVPGADKVRLNALVSSFEQHKPSALIFVIDCSTVQKECREVAEYLYSLLADYAGLLSYNRTPMLIVCNKQDLTSKSSKFVKSALEKEFALLNRTRSAALDHADPMGKSQNLINQKGLLLFGDRPFSFDDYKNITFVECSLLKADDDEGSLNVRSVIDWLNDL